MSALPLGNDRHEPLPLDPLGQRLCLTFPYLWQAIVGANEAHPHWQTLTKYPLRPRVLWRLWQDASQLVGVRFDSLTRYAVIDIDKASPYHPSQNPEALTTLRAALETIGLYRSTLLRSSWSGGLHLYLPLPEAVPTFSLASAIRQCLEAQDMQLVQGQLEVFPNCKTYVIRGSGYSEYNAHRLPLQPHSGSCLLDDDLSPVSTDLARFFEQWDSAAAGQDMEELRAALTTARHNRRGKRHRQSNGVEEWLNDLRAEMAEGWTGPGQTNHLLKTIACYGVVFEGLSDEALSKFIQETAVRSPGFAQWCRHQAEIKLKAEVWARSAAGYYWKFGDERQRKGRYPAGAEAAKSKVIPFSKNLQRAQDAQRRIEATVSQLEAEGTLPDTPTARAKAIAERGVSLKTLYRHPELWHPEHTPHSNPDHLIAMEQLCKTPDVEPDLASVEEKSTNSVKSPEPSNSKEFYTLEKQMKGKVVEIGPVSALDLFSSSPPTARRLSSVEQTDSVSVKVLPTQVFSCSGSPLQIPLLPSPFVLVDQALLEADCAWAVRQGNRGWILRRLFVLWSQGHSDLVRALCLKHSAWGVEVREPGPVLVDVP
jgi:hypothetical protein